MSIIDKSFFFDEFQVGSIDTLQVKEKLDMAISTYEPIYLEAVLGKTLYAAYKANPTDARFTALLALLTKSPSPIAAYVFFEYQNMRSLQATSGVDSKTRSENSTVSINTYRRSDAWNSMVESNFGIVKYLKTAIPEFMTKEVDQSYFCKTNIFGI